MNRQQLEQLQLQISNLIAELDQQPQQPQSFADQVEDQTQKILDQRIERLRKIEKFNAVFIVALKSELGLELAEFVVNTLDEGRRRKDWGIMRRVYPKLATLHQQKMVRVASCIYRIHWRKDKAYRAQLESQIRFNTACDHCGNLAQQIRDYLNNHL